MEFNKYLRRGRPNNKPHCYVCIKHEGFTEWHHVLPVAEQINKLDTDGFESIEYFDNLMVSLCANCHTYIHYLYKLKSDTEKMEFFKNTLKPAGYSASEYCKMEYINIKYNEYAEL